MPLKEQPQGVAAGMGRGLPSSPVTPGTEAPNTTPQCWSLGVSSSQPSPGTEAPVFTVTMSFNNRDLGLLKGHSFH